MNKKSELEIIKQKLKSKEQLTKSNLQKIAKIKAHNNYITSMANFPSGNFISLSWDQSIKIYDKSFNILQIISNAHEHIIYYVSIKDENNFVTCSLDESIKTWIKKTDNFILNQIIPNAHNGWVYKVLYCSNGNLISCSYDETVKIWENINNNYQSISTLKHSNEISSILLLEDKNILVSSGLDGTKLWNINNYENLSIIKAIGNGNNTLNRIDSDRIINGGFNGHMYIISISKKKVIQGIKNGFRCCGICVIEERGIFLLEVIIKILKYIKVIIMNVFL